MTPLDYATAALAALTQRAEWLEASLLPGTPRPFRPSHLTGEAREAADALARQERHERVDIAPGDSPDPIWTDGVELRTDLLMLADAMAEQIAQTAGVERMPDASWDSDPVPYLRHCSRWLRQAVEADADLAGKVERKCQQYVARLDALLGNVTDGQALPALCFVCGGRDAEHPVGGAYTLKYRMKHVEHPPNEHCPEWCRAYVVCEGGMCEPSSEQCGYRVRGKPAWDWLNELPWLLDRLNITDQRSLVDRCHCGKPLPDDSRKPGRKATYCSTACRVSAHRAKAA